MAWTKIEVCDICRNPARYRKALPIGRPEYGILVCPACAARKASIGIVDEGSFWRFYLYDNTGVASAQLDSVPMSAGPEAKSAALDSYRARLGVIAGATPKSRT